MTLGRKPLPCPSCGTLLIERYADPEVDAWFEQNSATKELIGDEEFMERFKNYAFIQEYRKAHKPFGSEAPCCGGLVNAISPYGAMTPADHFHRDFPPSERWYDLAGA